MMLCMRQLLIIRTHVIYLLYIIYLYYLYIYGQHKLIYLLLINNVVVLSL